MHTFLRCLLGAAIILTTGCRSEKVAFEFQPAAQPAIRVDLLPEAVASTVAIPAPSVVPSAAVPAQVGFTHRNTGLARHPGSRPLLAPPHHHAEAAAHPSSHQRGPRADDGTEHKTLHLVLGGLLVAGGVVGGILLGGWLGLGVGAAVVLGGYYFLGLAFGGKHGWREVFQEFFNM